MWKLKVVKSRWRSWVWNVETSENIATTVTTKLVINSTKLMILAVNDFSKLSIESQRKCTKCG